MRSGRVDGFRSSTHICDGICHGQCTNPDALRPIVPFAGFAQGLLDSWNLQRDLGSHQRARSVVAMHPDSAFLVADNEGPLHQSNLFYAIATVISTLNIITVFCIPIPILWKLKMSTARKWSLAAAFLVGTL